MVGEFEIQNLSARKDFFDISEKIVAGLQMLGLLVGRIFKMTEFSVIKRNFEPRNFVRSY